MKIYKYINISCFLIGLNRAYDYNSDDLEDSNLMLRATLKFQAEVSKPKVVYQCACIILKVVNKIVCNL